MYGRTCDGIENALVISLIVRCLAAVYVPRVSQIATSSAILSAGIGASMLNVRIFRPCPSVTNPNRMAADGLELRDRFLAAGGVRPGCMLSETHKSWGTRYTGSSKSVIAGSVPGKKPWFIGCGIRSCASAEMPVPRKMPISTHRSSAVASPQWHAHNLE